jgi:hypothetical protein
MYKLQVTYIHNLSDMFHRMSGVFGETVIQRNLYK